MCHSNHVMGNKHLPVHTSAGTSPGTRWLLHLVKGQPTTGPEHPAADD